MRTGKYGDRESGGERKGSVQIGVVIVSVTRGRGHGAEELLAYQLQAMGACGLRVGLVAPADAWVVKVARESGHHVVTWNSSRDQWLQNLGAAVAAGRLRQHARLLHAWTVRAWEAAVLAGLIWGIPVTATIYDHPTAVVHRWRRHVLMRLIAPRLRALVCVSEATRNACLEARYRTRLEVIYNGLPDEPPAPWPSDERFRIAFAGMYAPWKGFETVSELVRLARGLPVEWHLYGALCPENRHLLGRLRGQAGGSNLCYHGQVEPHQIFRDNHLILAPSLRFDPLPTVLIHAARAGRPSIGSFLGGASEIILDGETGFLFDPQYPHEAAQKIELLVRNRELARTMGAAARKRFEKMFRLDRAVYDYVHFWERYRVS